MTITTPSYVVPGTYLENVEFLDSVAEVSGVELLFFLYDDETDALFRNERDAVFSYADRFKFGVHMPDVVVAEHERIIDVTCDVADCYVIHEPPSDLEGFTALIDRWRRRYGDRFYLENLIGRDFAAAAAAVPEMPVCLDTGHLLMRGESPAETMKRYGDRVREIHLHGLADGKDHAPFGVDENWFLELAPLLRDFSGRVNIELFAIEQVRAVLDVLARYELLENS